MECLNWTLPEWLFELQYAQEMRLPEGQRSTEWVTRLPVVIAASNGEVTRLTGKKPSDAINARTVAQNPSAVVPGRPVDLKKQTRPFRVCVCYLHQPSVLEGGCRRASDLVWSLQVYRLECMCSITC